VAQWDRTACKVLSGKSEGKRLFRRSRYPSDLKETVLKRKRELNLTG
jgi:hypothetical protein